ncbi:MAG TPA: response regulator [Pirellulales bacterium]|jgi:response regulator RpfG family c-di-GMP phosphodiesterase|nr:response regulator [Pirellulales bacterium]
MRTAHDDSDRPRLLCIDDDPAVVAALTLRFKAYDVDVLTAFCGTQGIWQAIIKKPDAIITDLRMPNGTGDYVVECLKCRSDTCNIPLFVLTGTHDRETRRRLMTLGVDGWLQKPADFRTLVEMVGKHVDLQALQTN